MPMCGGASLEGTIICRFTKEGMLSPTNDFTQLGHVQVGDGFFTET